MWVGGFGGGGGGVGGIEHKMPHGFPDRSLKFGKDT